MFGHWFEILIVLMIGLLVFGPKRVIEMGSQLGKVVRELRESTRNMQFSSFLSTDEPSTPSTPSPQHRASQTAPTQGTGTPAAANGTQAPDERIVESAIEQSDDLTN